MFKKEVQKKFYPIDLYCYFNMLQPKEQYWPNLVSLRNIWGINKITRQFIP